MSKASEELSGFFKDQSSGGEIVPPGLSLSKIFGDIGKELSHMGAQGSHELAAALFTGSAFVMYPHAGQEAEAHGVHGEVTKQPEIEQSQGLEM